MNYQLYGNTLSLFTRKLEAALIFYGINFESLPSTEEINRRAGTHQIPVLLTPENWALADTTPIMQMLDGRFPDRAMFPTGLNGLLVRVLEEYLDEWVARVMVHYRWHYPECAEFAAIRIANGHPEIAKSIANWGPRACRATGTESQIQQKAAEDEYLRLLQAADDQLKRSPFLLGDRPCAVDAMFMGGLRGHTYADPVPKKIVSQFSHIVQWLEERADAWAQGPQGGSGELADFSQATDFALHILNEMPTSYQPFILGNKKALAAGDKFFMAHIYHEDVSYLTRPYPEQSRLMVVDYIQNKLNDDERAQAKVWLGERGLSESFC